MREFDRELFIDIETYSSVDIKECGAYKYIASPDFEILICGYAFGDDDVVMVDLPTVLAASIAFLIFSIV